MEQITESVIYHLDDENWTDGIQHGTNLWDVEDTWIAHENNSEI